MENYDALLERFVDRQEVFSGRVLHVVNDTVRLSDGTESHREVCLHSGGVCILPLLPDGTVIMERQYRYAHGRVFFELPAGKLDSADEIPLEAAKRELREETGAIPGKMTPLGRIATTPALMDEIIHVYLAEDLSFGDRDPDDGEFLTLERVPFKRLYEMVLAAEIEDAKTQIAILKTAAYCPWLLQ